MKTWPINHILWVLNLIAETKFKFSTLYTHFIKCHHCTSLPPPPPRHFCCENNSFLKAVPWFLRVIKSPLYKVLPLGKTCQTFLRFNVIISNSDTFFPIFSFMLTTCYIMGCYLESHAIAIRHVLACDNHGCGIFFDDRLIMAAV